jgi:hypothetical protein
MRSGSVGWIVTARCDIPCPNPSNGTMWASRQSIVSFVMGARHLPSMNALVANGAAAQLGEQSLVL